MIGAKCRVLRVKAMAPYGKNPSVLVYISNDQHIWLVNSGDAEVQLEAGELFGFNIGTWKEVAYRSLADVRIRSKPSTC